MKAYLPLTCALLLAGLTCACGVQVGTGAHMRSPTNPPCSVEIGGRITHPKGTGAFAGGHVAFADPAPDATFGARHVIGTAGYRLIGPGVGGEFGAEIGVGQPAFEQYGGSGMFSGGSAALLLRMWGDQDIQPGYAPIGFLADFVLTARGGLWTPPHDAVDTDPLGVISGHVGFRLSAITDLLQTTRSELEP